MMPVCFFCHALGGRRVRVNGLDVWVCDSCHDSTDSRCPRCGWQVTDASGICDHCGWNGPDAQPTDSGLDPRDR